MATATAAIITSTWSAMPTAVMIELMEKTRSMMAIWRMAEVIVSATRAQVPSVLLVLAFDVLMDLARALDQQEQTAGDQDEIAPGEVIAGRR